MRKLRGILVAGLAMGAFFGVLTSAHAQTPAYGQTQAPAYGQTQAPAYGQAPAPAYGQAPAPAPAPAYGQAPAYGPAPAPTYVQAPAPIIETPPPPVTAPKAPISDDMSGAVGVGVGVVAGNEFIKPDGAVAALRYWINDSLALAAQLRFTISTAKNTDTSWNLSPTAMILFSPKKVLSTRLLIGVGLGETTDKTPPADVTVGLTVPIFLGLEHSFARWFAMGIAMQDNLVNYTNGTNTYTFDISFNTTKYFGSLFFYTD